MSAPLANLAELIGALEPSKISCRKTAAQALTVVRDGVITGEGPTAKGRVHFSRALDAADAAWCARILTAAAVEHEPVSRAEAEALFEIDDAGAERSDNGRFDDLLAKAVVHHAASVSGLPVPPRTVALSPETAIESWAPTRSVSVDTEVLQWIASQMRGKRCSNRTLMMLVATIVGAAAPLVPNVFDIGM
jgi:VIT1/CCC1 family predicted Fe2+/Mn2+ transporter